MSFLPIVARELRTASRRRSTYWMRAGSSAALIILGTCIYLANLTNPKEAGIILFGAMTGAAGLHALFGGVGLTSDALSKEKREGTLGLLFLTDLKGYDVVLGKLAATSVNAVYGVLAAVPILAVPLMMGGVTPGEVGRMALVIGNTLFFSLAVGLGVSSVSRVAQKAWGASVALLLLFSAGCPLLAGLLMQHLMSVGNAAPWAGWLTSPGTNFVLAFDRTYRFFGPALFWSSLGTVHVLAWLFLGLACFMAPRSWQDKPPGAKGMRWREWVRAWGYGDYATRTAFRRRLLNRNPFYWLAARARLKPLYLWLTLGLIGVGWGWAALEFGRNWVREPMVYVVTGLVLNMLLKLLFASDAGRILAEERTGGSMELLLSTPLSVPEILRGQRMALWRQFGGPVGVVLALFGVFLIASLRLSREEEWAPWICFWVIAMVMLVVDMVALYWVAMWEGLIARDATQAARSSAGKILILPWGGMALLVLGCILYNQASRWQPGWGLFMGSWVVFGLFADVGFGTWARHRLLTRFRATAEQRPGARSGFWKRLTGIFGPGPQTVPANSNAR
jgi:ABC-type transport system involved in multi-copper enzyme maturation permease subunit